MINYYEISADAALSDFVKCYWWFESGDNKIHHTILPDGSFDLIVVLKNYQMLSLKLTGIWQKHVDVSIPPSTQLFGIRFKPLAAHYLFGRTISNILDSEEMLSENFWDFKKMNFANIMSVICNLNNRLAIIRNNGIPVNGQHKRLFDLIQTSNGSCTVAHYSTASCWSSRQINRYFSEYFGLSLKTYCNILKTHHSYRQIKDGNLYPELNYHDQSHFIHQVKYYTGFTPGELYKNENDRFLQLATLKD